MSSTVGSPNISWKTRFLLGTYSFAADLSRRSDLTVNRRLMSLFDPKSPPTPSRGVAVSDVVFNPSLNLWFRLYTPTSAAAKLPLIVFYHGGGFAFMAANSKIYDGFCRRLARKLPAVVVSVDYRLAPEHKFPAQHHDGYEALKFLDGGDCLPEAADLSRCFIAGDSAGGNIAHHVTLRACNGSDLSKLKIRGVIAIQPFFGGEERTESELRVVGVPLVNQARTDWTWRAWLGDGSDRDHPAVNVFGPKAEDISGRVFPATIVFVGGFDPLQDWQRRYCEGLKRSGKEARLVEYPSGVHGFYAMPELAESGLCIDEVKDFIVKNSPTPPDSHS